MPRLLPPRPLWISTVLVLLALGAGGIAGLYAVREMQAGAAALVAARGTLSRGASGHSLDRLLAGTRAPLSRALQHFQAAERAADPISPLLNMLGKIPGLSDAGNLDSAAHLAENLTAGGLLMDQELTRPDPPTQNTLSALMGRIRGPGTQFAPACAHFDTARRYRRQISRSPLLGAKLKTIDAVLPQLSELCRIMPSLPTILGYRGPRTYFVAYQNRNELRATGGFLGSLSYIRVNRGSTSVRFSGVSAHDRLVIAPPEPIQLYSYGYWVLRDANWSPDFPTTARLEMYFLHLDGQPHPDGVINLTVGAAQLALAATGPLYIPEYHRVVSADNVAALTDLYTQTNINPGPLQVSNAETERKQFIGIVTRRVLNAVRSLSARQLLELAVNMGTAMARGDLLLYFSTSSEERLLHHLHADGSIASTRTDYLDVVDTNLSFNKLNPYVHKWLQYSATVAPDRWVRSVLTVRIRNDASPRTFPASGIGPGLGQYGGRTDYATFLRVYVPAGANLISSRGWTQAWTGGPAYGKQMLCGYLIVPHGTSATIRLEYDLPPNQFLPTGGRAYRLLIQHQPGTKFDQTTVTIHHDDTSVTRTRRDVLTNWSITVPIQRRTFSPIPLPPQPPTVVAPGHWIEPHAYLGARP